MLTNYFGEIAALLASFCYALGPTMNTVATQRVSVATLNRARIVITLLFLVFIHWALYGAWIPLGLQGKHWFWLGISGLFSLVLGDSLLFAAFTRIGTRLGMLVISLIPVFSTVLAWFLLGETLAWIQIAGITTTISGIAWVVSDGGRESSGPDGRARFQGFFMALGAAVFHAIGNITAKLGMGSDLPALSGHLLRVLITLIILLLLMVIQGQFNQSLREIKSSPKSLKYILVGAIFGPVIGTWLMLFALQITDVGVVSSLGSLPPVLLLPVGRYFFNEHINSRAIIGSFVAVMGVVILFVF